MSLWSDITHGIGGAISGVERGIGSAVSGIERGIGSAGKAVGNVATDVGKYVGKHPIAAGLEGAALAASVALPFLAPELLAGIGGLTGIDAAAAAGVGEGAAAASAPLDILAGGTAAGTAGLEGLGSIAPAAEAAGGSLAPELTLAGTAGWPAALPGIGTFAGDAVGLGASAPSSALSFTGTPAAATAPSLGADTGLPSIISTGSSGGGGGGFDAATAFSTDPFNAPGGYFGAAPEAAPSVAAESPGFASGASSAASGPLNWLKSNPLMAASLGLGGANILKNIISPTKLPNEPQLNQAASQAAANAQSLNAQGQELLGPIKGGPLPAALEAQVTNALGDAITTTKARYAQLGLSGSTMESDQISYLQQQAVSERGKLAMNLAQEANSLISQSTANLGVEAGIYENLMNTQIAQDNALSSSIASFAGAAANAFATQSRPVFNVNATKAAA